MSMDQTPRGQRLHISVFGKRNAGKSTLINGLTNQETALVSPVPGTTTDPVYKAMEVPGIGPCVFIDTPGFDDDGELGKKRIEKTSDVLGKTDLALLVVSQEEKITNLEEEKQWMLRLRKEKIPVLVILNAWDVKAKETKALKDQIKKIIGASPLLVNGKEGTGIKEILNGLISMIPEEDHQISITGDLATAGEHVLLVMPQDTQAPKGRLILPQVQTIRELLDKKCIVTSCTPDTYVQALETLRKEPKLIITDSSVFKGVYERKPKKSLLTSFSVLFAGYKGDMDYFIKSANKIKDLTEHSKVLIAEACTHAAEKEDIGRVKIPALLKKNIGSGITIDIVSGIDFLKDLETYDLVIHCGGCMFNRKYVLHRIDRAKEKKVPMTNYGIVMAYFAGILDKISVPIR